MSVAAGHTAVPSAANQYQAAPDIAQTLGQDKGFGVGIFIILYLHFQIVMRVFVILHYYIQTDATACVVGFKRFFGFNVVDISNLNLQ